MIWATAKFTEVRSDQTAAKSRVSGSVSRARLAACQGVVVAIGRS
jgi:hypothetical protein